MYKYLTILALICYSGISYSQSLNTALKDDFAWNVKQIDEFIERFDDKDGTFIKQFSETSDKTILTRKKLLISLFNSENAHWDINAIKSFIQEVRNPKHPVCLKFFDENWCARLTCSVTWKGKPELVLLTLKIVKFPDESSKWVITQVNAPFLTQQHNLDIIAHKASYNIPLAKIKTTSLQPYSHATSFMNIDQVSKDKQNIDNYFQLSQKSNGGDMLVFMNEIIQGHLIINIPVSLIYNFYQVKGWFFEVREFNRETGNSGWLISKLTKLQPSMKSGKN